MQPGSIHTMAQRLVLMLTTLEPFVFINHVTRKREGDKQAKQYPLPTPTTVRIYNKQMG
jgi:hypothetical protein